MLCLFIKKKKPGEKETTKEKETELLNHKPDEPVPLKSQAHFQQVHRGHTETIR